MAFDPEWQARVQTRLTPDSVAVLMLQQHPDNQWQWLPVGSWSRMISAAERKRPTPILEAHAL